MNSPKISVIVPVYGVEKYIAKCLKSIQQQTFADFECIVVDDGSPDNSIEIGKSTINNDDRFIFVSKPNGGLASARNFGLDLAKGEYIAFIDSDDWVEPNFLELPYQKIIEEKADICMFGFSYRDETGRILGKELPTQNKLDKQDILLVHSNMVTLVAWSKLYSRKKLNNLYFDEGTITYEDVIFSLYALNNAKITFLDTFLYNYLQRAGSLSKDVKPSFLHDRLKIANAKKDFYLKNTKGEIFDKYYIYSYLKDFIFHAILKLARYSKEYRKDIFSLQKVIDQNLFTLKNILFVISQDKKVGLSLLLFKISPKAFRIFVKIWFRNRVA